MGSGFSNVAHSKKWYKKPFLGLTNFSFLQRFKAWNMEVDSPDRPILVGQPKFRELKTWEFYSIASKEMMTYVDNVENQNFKRVQTEIPMNNPTPVPKHYHTKIPTCMIFSMEEVVMRRFKAFEK